MQQLSIMLTFACIVDKSNLPVLVDLLQSQKFDVADVLETLRELVVVLKEADEKDRDSTEVNTDNQYIEEDKRYTQTLLQWSAMLAALVEAQ